MSTGLSLEEIAVGAVLEATLTDNSVADSPFPLRGNRLGGQRAPKVVLSKDPRIQAGVPCLVRVLALSGERPDRGWIEVEWAGALPLHLPDLWLEPVLARKLQVLLDSGLNILLDGPQGCGKTTLVRAIAEGLGMAFVFFNCGAVVEAGDFLATLQLRSGPQGQPVTDFVPTEILLALQQAAQSPGQRFLVFLDEFNRCQPGARNALMPALDSTRKVFNPIDNRFLPIPDNVQFVAAINRGRQFVGTFGLDPAQLDRFAPLTVGYPPPEQEAAILARRFPKVPPGRIQRVVAVAHAVRQSPAGAQGLSVRATEEACLYLSHPLMAQTDDEIREILKSSFCGRFSGRIEDPSSEAYAVWQVVCSTLAKPASC